jgi:cytochrome c553
MRLDFESRTGRRLRLIGLVTLGLLATGLIFAWSGLYSISASKGHWQPVKWLLAFGMRNSVETHAIGIDEPRTYSDDQAILGAGHYHGECASCHGAPSIRMSEAAKVMLPPPPDLAPEIPTWRDRELFWIVKNGIKYTGMPGWIAQDRDDEVWAVVAFLKRYPSLDAEGYRRLALGEDQILAQDGRQIAMADAAAEAIRACARCHGAERQGPRSKLVPILHTQPAEFLLLALEQFASGKRQSGIMQPVAGELTSAAMATVAAYYAALPAPPGTPASDPAAIARGRVLAENGDDAAKVPACAGCHGASALPAYPRLAGQNAPYMHTRLSLWKQGLPANTDTAALMAPIARALTNEQIADLSAYYASLQPTPAASAVRP